MTLEGDPARYRGPSAWALIFVLGCLPLGWVPVTNVGSFDLTLPYTLTLVLGATLVLKFGRATLALGDLSLAIAPWFAPYLLYLLATYISLVGQPDGGTVLRQSFFLSCGLIVGCTITMTRANPRPLRIGGAVAVLGFLGVTEYFAQQIGLGWSTALARFFSGDLGFVIYKFLREIFRTAQFGGEEVPASVKNIVAVGLFTGLVIFRAGHQKLAADRLGQVISALTLVVLLLLNTRSVLLLVIIALPLAWIIAMTRRSHHSAEGLVLKIILVIVAVATVLVFLSSNFGAFSIIQDRFTFGDNSVGGRFRQIELAMIGIEQNIFFGAGLVEVDGQLVHNLFLGAWFHAGIVAFFMVVAAYAVMVWTWLSFIFDVVVRQRSWVLGLRPEWVAVLPMVPLFRVWVSGDAGHPDFASWVALFTFFAIVHVNKTARRSTRWAAGTVAA